VRLYRRRSVNDNILVDEHEIGTCQMTKELEEAFILSCKHNKTTPNDIVYIRLPEEI